MFRLAERDLALETYRPYLLDPEPDVQMAALDVTSGHWDADVVPILVQLEDGNDPGVRSKARHLGRTYMVWGNHRPAEGQTVLDQSFWLPLLHQVPVDPEGLAAWDARESAWRREQYILIPGTEPEVIAPPERIPEDAPRIRAGGAAPAGWQDMPPPSPPSPNR